MFVIFTGENMFKVVTRVLDAIHPEWGKKLIGVTTDGAANMVGCYRGLATRLENVSSPGLYRIWCGAHQLDLVIKHSIRPVFGEKFVFVLQNIINELNKDKRLVKEIGECPRLVQTHWISMGFVLNWLVPNRVRVMEHLQTCDPGSDPPGEW